MRTGVCLCLCLVFSGIDFGAAHAGEVDERLEAVSRVLEEASLRDHTASRSVVEAFVTRGAPSVDGRKRWRDRRLRDTEPEAAQDRLLGSAEFQGSVGRRGATKAKTGWLRTILAQRVPFDTPTPAPTFEVVANLPVGTEIGVQLEGPRYSGEQIANIAFVRSRVPQALKGAIDLGEILRENLRPQAPLPLIVTRRDRSLPGGVADLRLRRTQDRALRRIGLFRREVSDSRARVSFVTPPRSVP
jgi:hypothetical protein